MFHSKMLIPGGIETFRLLDYSVTLPGVDNLNPSLTINGTTVTPTFRYKGGDANGTDWDAWTYGSTLTLQAGTVPSYNQGSPGLGTNDDSVLGNAGGFYKASSTTFGEVGTNDLVIECVFKIPSDVAATKILFSSKSSQPGYDFRIDTLIRASCIFYDGTDVVAPVSAALDLNTWYHCLVFFNRDEASTNGCQIYINGTASGAGKDGSAIDSMDGAGYFSILATESGVNDFDGNIAYVALWQQASWHQAGASGPAEWATIAKERFLRLTGHWPQKAKGTKAPTTATRASQAYLDKIEGTAQVLSDGDMEAANTSAWTAVAATLSKEDGTRTGGSGSKVLKITYNGSPSPAAVQTKMVAGERYRATGWARGNGTDAVRVLDNFTAIWTGTSSTDWQYFDVVFAAASTTFKLQSLANAAAEWGEFDDVVLEKLTPRKLYLVGDNWLRSVNRFDSSGETIQGYLAEQASENLCLYSESFGAGAWFPIDTGDGILADADMEAGDVASWTAVNNATLTKETNPRTGSVGASCLRVAYSDTAYPMARTGTILAVDGTKYRVTGWARGDGTYAPTVRTAATDFWTGTSSTDWQYFDEIITPAGTSMSLRSTATGAGYSEFDDIMIYSLTDAPNKQTVGVSLIADSTDGDHGLSQAITLTAATYTFSVFAKAGDKSWLYLADEVASGLADGDMEAVDTSAWNAGASATLTKEGSAHGGSLCLRVAYGGEINAFASQPGSCIASRKYLITGWARSDGTILPRVINASSGATLWTGTDSTDWQEFSVVATASSTTGFGFRAVVSGAGYVEFDDVAVTEIKDCYFNLATGGALGTASAGATGYIENWGDGWKRCAITFTGTAAAHTLKVQSANADTDKDFAGDGSTINTYIWGTQCEQHEYMTSYYPTTSAALTRVVDVLTYKGDDGNVMNNQKGTIFCDLLKEAQDLGTDVYIAGLSDGGGGTDRMSLFYEATGDKFRIFGGSAEGGAGTIDSSGTTDIVDGTIHNVRATWQTNSVKVYVDGSSEGSEDTSCTPPNDIDRIEVGMLYSGVSQGNAVISDLRILKIPKAP